MRMRKSIVCLLFLLGSVACWAGETWEFTILHTNDLHGQMMSFDYLSTNYRFPAHKFVNDRYAQADAGGLARRATLLSSLRKTINHPVALIDAGDIFTRGPWHTQFYGVPEVEIYNQLGYDMLCVGNNEFKATGDVDSQQRMLSLMRQSRFPWLTANLTVGDTGVPVEGIHPYIVRRYGTIRVGFLGLTAPRSAAYQQTQGWTISDPIAAAQKWVPIARDECDILIAVTHIGETLDRQLAAQVEGIDAIIGGDSHTFIPQPEIVTNPLGVKVPIVQAGEYGICVGRVDFTFEKTDDWKLIHTAGKLIPVDASVKDDPAIRHILEQWIKPVTPEKSDHHLVLDRAA